jgi:drug/metabolite transporter (DMT)-like permease
MHDDDTDMTIVQPLSRPQNHCHQYNCNHHWISFLFGQCIAFIAASMNASSYILVTKYDVRTKLFQLFWVYLLLSFNLKFGLRQPHSDDDVLDDDDDDAAAIDEDTSNLNQRNNEMNREVTGGSTNADDVDSLPLATASDGPRDAVAHEDIASSHPFPFIPSIRLRIPWKYYLCISILDITPNFMALYSFKYTSLTSTTLLGSLSVPSTMLFSRLILYKVFTRHHYIGVLLCVLGGCLTVYMDAYGTDNNVTTGNANQPLSSSIHERSYIGDILAVAAAIMYGLGDCVAEYSVKHINRHEYLGMIGFFGLFITGMIFPWLEYDALYDLFRTAPTTTTAVQKIEMTSLMIWFIISVSLYYVAEARFLVTSDATLLNLSMQSVNLWAYVFTLTTDQSSTPPTTFFIALVLVVVGVFIYEIGFCRRDDYNLTDSNTDNRYTDSFPQQQVTVRRNSEVEIVKDHPGRSINYQSLAPGID